MNSQNLFFFLSFTCVFSFPTNENPEEIQHQLLNPELNSVLEKGIQDGSEAPITKDIFPDRQGFVTGHRIPLELFSKETIQSLKPVSYFIITDRSASGVEFKFFFFAIKVENSQFCFKTM